MEMMKLIKFFAAGTLFLFLALWLFFVSYEVKFLDPANLPDHDFLPQIRKMMAEKRFTEAEQLCCNVIGMGLPNADAANKTLLECRKARRSWSINAIEAVRGFITGEGKNVSSVAGAVISDFFLYGDLRDLGIQGFNFILGKPVDKVMVSIAGAGVVTELLVFPGAALPSGVKQLYRAGVLSPQIGRRLREALTKSNARKTAVAAADRKFLEEFRELTAWNGLDGSKQLLRGISTAEELSAAVKVCKKAPEVPWLLALSAPADCGKLMLHFGDSSINLLRTAVRKGPRGAELLRKIRTVKWGAKNILKGRFHDLLRHAALENRSLKHMLPWAGGGLLLAAFFFYGRAAVICGTVLRGWRKKRSEVEDAS